MSGLKFESFEHKLTLLEKAKITTPSKNLNGINQGLEGEKNVFKILQGHSFLTFRNVPMWNNKHTFVTEIDFISVINGFLVLIEVKQWFGSLHDHPDSSKVFISYINFDGQHYKQERTNPIFTISSFSNDLKVYLSKSYPIKKNKLKNSRFYKK